MKRTTSRPRPRTRHNPKVKQHWSADPPRTPIAKAVIKEWERSAGHAGEDEQVELAMLVDGMVMLPAKKKRIAALITRIAETSSMVWVRLNRYRDQERARMFPHTAR
jgi:hypothetical protein